MPLCAPEVPHEAVCHLCSILTSSILTEGLTQKQMGEERWEEGWQG